MLRQIRTLGLSGYATEFGFPENSYRRSTRNLRSGSCHPDLGGLGYRPKLQEVSSGHCVAKHNPLETNLAARTSPGTPRATVG